MHQYNSYNEIKTQYSYKLYFEPRYFVYNFLNLNLNFQTKNENYHALLFIVYEIEKKIALSSLIKNIHFKLFILYFNLNNETMFFILLKCCFLNPNLYNC